MRMRLLCWIAVIEIAFAAFARPAAAQTDYQGLDVLFLVDQSGSMGGQKFGSRSVQSAKDPLGLRFQAVQYAFQTLSDYNSIVPTGTAFRMGVINFGDAAEIALPWTAVEPTAPDWPQRQQQILQQLSQNTFGFRNLGNTNFIAAYREAQTIFNSLPALPGGTKHLRTIIILTDGAPCVPAEFQNQSCSDPRDRIQHMNQLIQLTTQAFPPPDYRLFVIGLSDQQGFWPEAEPAWRQIAGLTGTAQRIQRSEEVGPSFLKILLSLVQVVRPATNTQDLIGRQVPLSGQTTKIDVPPYLKSMRVTLFKTQPQSKVTLTNPNGGVLTDTSPEVLVSGAASAIEAWTIADPLPGQWQLNVRNQGDLLDVYLDLIRVSWKLDAPRATTMRSSTVPVTMRLVNSKDQPLPNYSDPRFALSVEATLVAPDGKTQHITLQQSVPGTYTGNVTPDQEGTYNVDLVATTQNVDGSAFTVANQKAVQSFVVTGLTLEVKAPSLSELLQTQPLNLSAHVRDVSGELADNASVEAILQGPSGSERHVLTRQADNSFAASIPMDKLGQFKVDVKATVPGRNGGDPTVITKTALAELTVKPASVARLNVVAPKNDATQYTTGGFPNFTPQALVVRIAAMDSQSQPLDLASLAGGQVPLNLQILDSEDKPITQSAKFIPVGDKGIYEVSIAGLGAGDYKVVVQADEAATAGAGTVFEAASRSKTLVVHMALNPALLAAYGGAGLLVLGVVSGVGFGVYRRRQRRQHPATGRIAILREDLSLNVPERDTVWSLSLDGRRSNRIVVTRLPASLRRLIIECPDANLSKRGQVVVTLEGKKRAIFKRVTLGRGSERIIDDLSDGDTVYYLAKDYENA